MSERAASSAAPAPAGTSASPVRGYVFAFTAAVAYAVSQVLARHGVSDFQAPIVGTTIALGFASIGFILILARNLESQSSSDFRRGSLFFGVAGIFSAIGVTSMFLALENADVVIVSPVSSVNPLFTLLFAAILLRDLERIHIRTLMGSALVVLGVIIIAIA